MNWCRRNLDLVNRWLVAGFSLSGLEGWGPGVWLEDFRAVPGVSC